MGNAFCRLSILSVRSSRALRCGTAGGSYGGSVLRCLLGFGARASVLDCPPMRHGSRRAIRFPREAGARTDEALFTLARSSPPSIALRPRVAARSPMSGASWPATQAACTDERARPGSRRSPRALRCGMSAVAAATARRASVASAHRKWPPTGVRLPPFDPGSSRRWSGLLAVPAGVLIATFRCAAPARCGAFVDERCIAAGDCDAVGIFPRSIEVGTPGAAIVPHTLVVPSPRATRRAIPRRAVGIDERARPWSRRSPRVLRGLELELIATLQAGKLIATFHRAAPARYGAFADGRRVVMGDEGGRVYCKRARPWSRRAGDGGGCGRTRTLIQSSRIAKSSGAVGPRATTRRAIPDRALGTSERACLWLLQSYGAAFRYTVYCIELKCKNGGGLVAWRSQQPEPYR